MLMCNNCGKRPATVHITEIDSDQKKVETHLCEDCAQEKNVVVPQTLSLNDILSGLIEAHSEKDAPELADTCCPSCGSKYSDFRANARVGCAHDYDVFRKGLVPVLERMHGSVRHTGKVSARAGRDVAYTQRLANLRRQLNKAIETENYEDAAKYRDQITDLKKECRDAG